MVKVEDSVDWLGWDVITYLNDDKWVVQATHPGQQILEIVGEFSSTNSPDMR